MECLLCDTWARMPYAKRHTTPTTASETEGALVVGYWIASRQNTAPRMCERHLQLLEALDNQEEQRIVNEQKAQQEAVTRAARRPVSVPTAQHIHNPQESGFSLGPGPLSNENTAASHIPIGTVDLAAPYRKVDESKPLEPRHRAKPTVTTVIPVLSEPVTELPQEEPVEGGKFTHPCPLCGKTVTTGEVHSC